MQLTDSTLALLAFILACSGLVLLVFSTPQETAGQYLLLGTVVERHGRAAVVNTNVTVIGKNLNNTVKGNVFWNGEAFVIIP
jgi:hypothetical protein